MTSPIPQAEPPAAARSGAGTHPVTAAPSCPYCGDRYSVIIDDEVVPCWCQQPDADVAAKAALEGER
jgi:hypothetical protein